jgi:LysM repeat protein
LRKWRRAVNNFRRSGEIRAPRRNGFNFTRRWRFQRRFQARANEPKQFNKPWNLPRENFAAKQSKSPRRKDAIRAKPMNNTNPFVPQGSVLEQNKRRSRMKVAVFCVLAVSVAGLSAMLIQGCKKEQTPEIPPTGETNPPPMLDTNPPPVATNPPVVVPPLPTNPPVVSAIVPEATGSEYTVVKGDTLAKIAKAHGVTLKALEAANPGVVPTKLKVNQKLAIPAGGAAAPAAAGTATVTDVTGASTGGGETYTVKSGDTLTKIAKAHGTTVKLIQSANNLSTTKIKVGDKLKLPAKAEAAAPAPAPAPVSPPAPAVAPVGTPAPAGTSN